MERLPLELLSIIFALACTDSGFTGRSLSLVSRHIHFCSKPYKYQSVHLPRPRHILAFRDVVKGLRNEEKRVRFLGTPCPHLLPGIDEAREDVDFVPEEEREAQEPDLEDEVTKTGSEEDAMDVDSSDSDDLDYEGLPLTPSEYAEVQEDSLFGINYYLSARYKQSALPPSLYDPASDLRLRGAEEHTAETDREVLIAFREILSEVAGSLRVLSVFWRSLGPVRIEVLFVPLPVLEELHLHRQLSDPRHSFASNRELHLIGQRTWPSSVTLFPNVRRMYVAGYRERWDLRLGQVLNTLAPRLEHLRMSHAHVSSVSGQSYLLPLLSLQSITISMDRYIRLPVQHPPLPRLDELPGLLFGMYSQDPRYSSMLEVIEDQERDDMRGDWEARWDDVVSGRRGERERSLNDWVVW